jgi:hypothetical protein
MLAQFPAPFQVTGGFMFMVAWEGQAPPDKSEWMQAMRPVFAGSAGTYRVKFLRGPRGWRIHVDCENAGDERGDVVANGPETIRFNLVQALRERAKPVDPDWVEGDPQPTGGAR